MLRIMSIDDIFELFCGLSQYLPLIQSFLKLIFYRISFMSMLKVFNYAICAKDFLIFVFAILFCANI